MPRNGGGVYSLPGTYEATSGETIEAQQHNDPLEDLESDMNAARPIVAGGTGATTAVGGNDALSTKGANIASAGTCDIGAATGRYVHITGTTAITAFGTKTAGVVRVLTFDGALTLTHNATSLILPGGADIVTAAGDVAVMVSEGSGNWKCIAYLQASLALPGLAHHVCQGRLTLTTAVPVTTSDVTGAGTVYFTPFNGNRVWLYTGSVWVPVTLTELSLALSGLTASKPADIFLDYNAGTPQLVGTSWTNESSRATALTTQDGVYVQTGNLDWRYLGTIYVDGSNQCEDSLAKRHVWNMYNRRRRPMKVVDTTDSWSYTTASYQQANANTANQLDMVIGLNEDAVEAALLGVASHSASAGILVIGAIGLNSATTKATDCVAVPNSTGGANFNTIVTARYSGLPGIGRNTLVWLEYSQATGTTTWYGDGGGSNIQTGLTGSIWA